jgi:hypothetical protein
LRTGLARHPSRTPWRLRAGCTAVLLLVMTPSLAQERPPGMAVASALAAAARAGMEVMQGGGNAFDPAVAMSAALALAVARPGTQTRASIPLSRTPHEVPGPLPSCQATGPSVCASPDPSISLWRRRLSSSSSRRSQSSFCGRCCTECLLCLTYYFLELGGNLSGS